MFVSAETVVKNRRLHEVSVAGLFFLQGISFGNIFFLKPFLKHIGFTEEKIQAYFTISAICSVLIVPFLSAVADYFNKHALVQTLCSMLRTLTILLLICTLTVHRTSESPVKTTLLNRTVSFKISDNTRLDIENLPYVGKASPTVQGNRRTVVSQQLPVNEMFVKLLPLYSSNEIDLEENPDGTYTTRTISETLTPVGNSNKSNMRYTLIESTRVAHHTSKFKLCSVLIIFLLIVGDAVSWISLSTCVTLGVQASGSKRRRYFGYFMSCFWFGLLFGYICYVCVRKVFAGSNEAAINLTALTNAVAALVAYSLHTSFASIATSTRRYNYSESKNFVTFAGLVILMITVFVEALCSSSSYLILKDLVDEDRVSESLWLCVLLSVPVWGSVSSSVAPSMIRHLGSSSLITLLMNMASLILLMEVLVSLRFSLPLMGIEMAKTAILLVVSFEYGRYIHGGRVTATVHSVLIAVRITAVIIFSPMFKTVLVEHNNYRASLALLGIITSVLAFVNGLHAYGQISKQEAKEKKEKDWSFERPRMKDSKTDINDSLTVSII